MEQHGHHEFVRVQAGILTLAVLSFFAGCSRGGPQTATVTGRVTLDGQPLGDVSVLFHPISSMDTRESGADSYGITDAQGRYTLRFSDTNKPGAVVGSHEVRIIEKTDPSNDPDAGPSEKPSSPRIPSKYSENFMTVEVKRGTKNQLDLDLKSQ